MEYTAQEIMDMHRNEYGGNGLVCNDSGNGSAGPFFMQEDDCSLDSDLYTETTEQEYMQLANYAADVIGQGVSKPERVFVCEIDGYTKILAY